MNARSDPPSPKDMQLAADEIVEQVLGGNPREDEVDLAKFYRALAQVPELLTVLTRFVRGELTVKEARELGRPHLEKFRKIYPKAEGRHDDSNGKSK